MEMTNLNVRVDKEIKRSAEAIADALGMNLSTAVNIFLRQMISAGGMPFDVRLRPNAVTLQAMQETEDILSGRAQSRSYGTVQELFEDLDREADD